MSKARVHLKKSKKGQKISKQILKEKKCEYKARKKI